MGRWWVIGIASTIVLVIAAGLFWWWVVSKSESSPSNAEDGREAAQALELLETDPSSLLPAELADAGVSLQDAVPPGTMVEADPSTWMPSEAGGGVIEVQLTFQDGTTSLVAAVMVKDPNGWKVLQTIALERTE